MLGLSLAACRREEHAPAPSASASSAGSDFTTRARERHFEQELARSAARWQLKPSLGDCAKTFQERADRELCQAASNALDALAAEPATTPAATLERLAAAALALVRLSERARYLSLSELAERRVSGDGGAAPAPSASSPSAARRGPRPLEAHASARAEQHALTLKPSLVSQLLETAIHLEREVLRNLGAYLEYGSLPDRRAAFETAKRLRAQHPQWPALDHLLREARVLEPDGDLRRQLSELSSSGSASSGSPAQSAWTK